MAPVALACATLLLGSLVPILGTESVIPEHSFVEPEELPWRENRDGSFSGDLYMGWTVLGHSDNATLSIRTRAFGSSPGAFTVPGPTIVMRACNTYYLTLTNTLEPPSNQPEWNHVGAVNTTNLHLHGLHISGSAPGDEIFSTTVEPGESYEYTYKIPCDHIGGLFWYHAHYHGSMALQVGGGASGLVKMEYNDWEGIPEQIRSMPQVVMQVKEIECKVTKMIAYSSNDTLFDCSNRTRLVNGTDALTDDDDGDDDDGDGGYDPYYLTNDTALLVNGYEQPEISLERGQWHHVRTSFVTNGDGYEMYIRGGADGNCDVELLATDGVWLSEVPRPLSNGSMFFTPASRIDYAIRCRDEGPVSLVAMKRPIADVNRTTEATTFYPARFQVHVSVDEDGEEAPDAPDLVPWLPCRPYYLLDLLDVPAGHPDAPFLLTLRGGGYDGTINELKLQPEDGVPGGDFFMDLYVDEVQEWTIKGSQLHTTHMHINHFQIVNQTSSELAGLTENWYKPGDWYDTIMAGHSDAIIKFRPDRFGGPVALHCHVLDHSDYGIMVAMNLVGGAGPFDTPAVLKLGTCDIPPGRRQPATDSSGSSNDAAADADDAAATLAEGDETADRGGSGGGGGGLVSWGMAVVGVLVVAGVFAGFVWLRRRRRRHGRGGGLGYLSEHRVPIFDGSELSTHSVGGGGGESWGGAGGAPGAAVDRATGPGRTLL